MIYKPQYKVHPKIVELQLRNQANALKFCKDCAYHSCANTWEKTKVFHQCSHPQLLNLLTGEKSNPVVNRNTETLCGRKAAYFTPRQPKEKPDE